MDSQFPVMESESCELYIAAGMDGREYSWESERRMVVNFKIMEARNIVVKPDRDKQACMFVRYHLRAGDGEGNNVAVNTKEEPATPDPHWKQTFQLECRRSPCELQKESVIFELRQRRRIRILGISMFRSSKVVGWVEIPWKDLFSSPTLSISTWFPLVSSDTSTTNGGSQSPPSLHLSISLNPSSAADWDSGPPHQHQMEIDETNRFSRISKSKVADETSWGVGLDPEVVVWKTANRRNADMNMNVNRRIRRLERLDEENYAAMSSN